MSHPKIEVERTNEGHCGGCGGFATYEATADGHLVFRLCRPCGEQVQGRLVRRIGKDRKLEELHLAREL